MTTSGNRSELAAAALSFPITTNPLLLIRQQAPFYSDRCNKSISFIQNYKNKNDVQKHFFKFFAHCHSRHDQYWSKHWYRNQFAAGTAGCKRRRQDQRHSKPSTRRRHDALEPAIPLLTAQKLPASLQPTIKTPLPERQSVWTGTIYLQAPRSISTTAVPLCLR